MRFPASLRHGIVAAEQELGADAGRPAGEGNADDNRPPSRRDRSRGCSDAHVEASPRRRRPTRRSSTPPRKRGRSPGTRRSSSISSRARRRLPSRRNTASRWITSAPMRPRSPCGSSTRARPARCRPIFSTASPSRRSPRAAMCRAGSPMRSRHLPKDRYDPAGLWAASNIYVLTPGFNTELVPKGTEPKTFEDLLDPKWKGKMAWSSTNTASERAGFRRHGAHRNGRGQGARLFAETRQAEHRQCRWVGPPGPRRGHRRRIFDRAANLQSPHHDQRGPRGRRRTGSAWNPAMVMLNIVSLTTHSPHPNAGKLLFDFLESEEGQKLFRDADYLPADPARAAARPVAHARERPFPGDNLLTRRPRCGHAALVRCLSPAVPVGSSLRVNAFRKLLRPR